MSHAKSEILPLLRELCTGTYSVSASNQLIEDCIRIAKHYLYTKRTNLYKFILNDDVQVIDLAIDAVAPLFCKNANEEILPILKEFQSWQPPIQTEDDALFFLNKVVANRVDQHISHLLKEHDPFFAKIFDSVSYLVRKDEYKKIAYFGRKFIVRSICNEITGKVIDSESFEKLPTSLFQNKKTLFSDILAYLENETEFSPAIPVNGLVNKLKQIASSNFNSQNHQNNLAVTFDIAELVSFGLTSALSKLSVSYVDKGKLSSAESEQFRKTLEDLANDLKDGGINRGLYEYFSLHADGICSKVYQEKYRNILEYLLKVMKSTIREQLIEEKA